MMGVKKERWVQVDATYGVLLGPGIAEGRRFGGCSVNSSLYTHDECVPNVRYLQLLS